MKSGGGIVLELQRAPSNSAIAVSDLLQRALLVARKLKIIDQESWILSEWNGYLEINGNYDLIPPYRFLKSKLDYEKTSSGDTVFYDLYSLGINPSDPHENTEKYPCHVSVPEIERMLEGEAKNNFVHIPCQPDVEKHYREDVKLPPSFPIVLTVQASHLRGILNDVRNRIRDWAWKLDENGIIGKEPPAQTGASVPTKPKPKRAYVPWPKLAQEQVGKLWISYRASGGTLERDCYEKNKGTARLHECIKSFGDFQKCKEAAEKQRLVTPLHKKRGKAEGKPCQ